MLQFPFQISKKVGSKFWDESGRIFKLIVLRCSSTDFNNYFFVEKIISQIFTKDLVFQFHSMLPVQKAKVSLMMGTTSTEIYMACVQFYWVFWWWKSHEHLFSGRIIQGIIISPWVVLILLHTKLLIPYTTGFRFLSSKLSVVLTFVMQVSSILPLWILCFYQIVIICFPLVGSARFQIPPWIQSSRIESYFSFGRQNQSKTELSI